MMTKQNKSNWRARWLNGIDGRPSKKIDASGFGKQDNCEGWYVEIVDAVSKKTKALPLRFARKIDAEKAASTLNAKIPALTIEMATEKTIKLGLKNLRELMVENLAW
jgi:hypothetical protein